MQTDSPMNYFCINNGAKHSTDMENPIENVNAVEVIDSKIIDAIKTIPYLNEKLLSLSTEINALKSFVLQQVFVIKKTLQDIQELSNNKETNNV